MIRPFLTAYHKAFLRMDGADGSTTFTDLSGKTWTAHNQAQIDTAQKRFGGASGLFDGTTDWVSTPNHADFDAGAGDFYGAFWVKYNVVGTVELFTKRGSAGDQYGPFLYYQYLTTGLGFYSSANGTSWGVALVWTHNGYFGDGKWHFVEMFRKGNDWKIVVDGCERASTTVSQTVYVNVVTPSLGGNSTGTNSLNGWLDNFEWMKGHAPTVRQSRLKYAWMTGRLM